MVKVRCRRAGWSSEKESRQARSKDQSASRAGGTQLARLELTATTTGCACPTTTTMYYYRLAGSLSCPLSGVSENGGLFTCSPLTSTDISPSTAQSYLCLHSRRATTLFRLCSDRKSTRRAILRPATLALHHSPLCLTSLLSRTSQGPRGT